MNTQVRQYKIWRTEHTSPRDNFLPGHASAKVTDDVVHFQSFIKLRRPDKKRPVILDVGAGKGRNTLHFLRLGYKVVAIDFIQEALDVILERARAESLDQNLVIKRMQIETTWPFPDNHFDFAIDSLTSIDIDGLAPRTIYKKELFRTLKDQGMHLFRCVSVNDVFEKELMIKSPGKERNSSIWPQTGKFQKNYSYEEIKDFYKEFKILELTEYVKKAKKMGNSFEATNFRVIMQKATIKFDESNHGKS